MDVLGGTCLCVYSEGVIEADVSLKLGGGLSVTKSKLLLLTVFLDPTETTKPKSEGFIITYSK